MVIVLESVTLEMARRIVVHVGAFWCCGKNACAS